MSVDLSLVLFALVAALSPMAFAATLAVIKAGRLKALAFAVAIIVSQFLVGWILVSIGGWSVPNHGHAYPTARGILMVAFAAGLLLLAARVRRRPPGPQPRSSPRAEAVLARLERVHTGTALLAGLLLGIGGPKRLVLTALAAAAIATSPNDAHGDVLQLAVYTAAATVLVWAPVLTFELFGDRALQTIDRAGRWLARRQQKTVVAALLVLAAGALAGAAALLL